MATSLESGVPKSYKDIARRSDAEDWMDAVKTEYKGLMQNETWELTHLPPDRKHIFCHWIFRNKLNEDGHIVRRKARLVVDGSRQIPGLDYDETYAPVASHSSLRIFLPISATKDWEIDQGDISTAFLLAKLPEGTKYT